MYISILGAHKAKTEVFLEKADIPTKLPPVQNYTFYIVTNLTSAFSCLK